MMPFGLDTDGPHDDAISIGTRAAIEGTAARDEGQHRAGQVIENFQQRSRLGAILLHPGDLVLKLRSAVEV